MTDDSRTSPLSRRNVLTGIGAGMAGGLAGCSGDGGNGNGGNGNGNGNGNGGGSQDLEFWLFGGTPAEREYISDHASNHSDHNVTYQHQEWGEKYQIIASAAANDNLPNVMSGQGIEIPDYAGADAIEPIDTDAFQDRLDDVNDNFIQANVDALTYADIGGYDGERQWAMPGGYADIGPFIDVRTDYLEETSFDEPPRTWEELIQVAEEMQDVDEIDAAVTTSGNDQGLTAGYFIGFVYANGGRYYDPDSLEATIDQPGFVDAVQLYQDIAEAGLFPDAIAENDHIEAGRRLIEGNSGIFITYSHANAVMETIDAPEEWYDGEGHTVTRAPLPDSPSGNFEQRDLLLQNAQAFMLATGSDGDAQREASLDYIEWWSQEEQLAPWTGDPDNDVGIRGRLPTLQSAYDDPPELMEGQFGDVVRLYEQGELFNNTTRFPSFSGLASVQSEINRSVLQPVMTGEATAEEACSDANGAVQEIIDEELA